MMKRILVPMDVSLASRSALPLASALARESGAELVLLTVVADPTPFDPLLGVDATQEQQVHNAYLAQISGELSQQGVNARHVVMQGHPAAFIVMFAETQQVDLIAMATHARGTVDRWSLGSVADEVMRTAPVPVLLIRSIPADRPPVEQLPKRILVPLDGSLESEIILPHAIDIAAIARSEIVLLHVVEDQVEDRGDLASRDDANDPTFLDAVRAWETRRAWGYLASVASQYAIDDQSRTDLVEVGPPRKAISDVVMREHIDLVAMSTHGRSGIKRFVLGSVATQTLRACPVPLLTVSAGYHMVHVSPNTATEWAGDTGGTRISNTSMQ